jgi:hypothetical protein
MWHSSFFSTSKNVILLSLETAVSKLSIVGWKFNVKILLDDLPGISASALLIFSVIPVVGTFQSLHIVLVVRKMQNFKNTKIQISTVLDGCGIHCSDNSIIEWMQIKICNGSFVCLDLQKQ